MIAIILLLFFFIAFLSFFNLKKKLKTYIYFILSILFILYASFRDGNTVNDYYVYVRMFEDNLTIAVEYSFILISSIVKLIFGNNVIFLFIIYATLAVSIKFYAIKRLTPYIFCALLIYLSDFYILHELTQMRVSVACSVLILSVIHLYEKKKIFFLDVAIATFFHATAIIMILLWFLNVKKINPLVWLGLILFSYIIYYFQVNFIHLVAWLPLSSIQAKLEAYNALSMVDKKGEGINVFSLYHIGKIIIFVLLLFNADKIARKNQYIYTCLKIMGLSLFCWVALSSLMVVAMRVSEFWGVIDIVLFPSLIYLFKQKVIPNILIVSIAGVLMYVRIVYGQLILY
jgi:hypothetical protein